MNSALASMTGFARAEGAAAGLAWVWELRSVNGRGLDLRFRLPPGWDALEPALREAAGKALKRGNVTANLTVKRESELRLLADPAALEQALTLAMELHRRHPRQSCATRRGAAGPAGRAAAGAGRRGGTGHRCGRGRLLARAGGTGGGAPGRGRAAGRDAHRPAGRDRRAASPGRGRGGRPARGAAGAGHGEPGGPAARGAVIARGAHRAGGRAAGRAFRRARGTGPAGKPHRGGARTAARGGRTSAGASTSWCRSSIARPTRCAASRRRWR